MIIVVTVYKSNNFGSYLQAWALYRKLSVFDKDVRFLDGGIRNINPINIIKHTLKLSASFRFLEALRWWKRNWGMYRAWEQLPCISMQESQKKEDVIYVIGSDEIWNVQRASCRKPILWGVGLKGKIVSYAVSLNNADILDLNVIDYTSNISNFSFISVRDLHSKEVVEEFSGKNAEICLDPTLLFKPEDFFSSIRKWTIIENGNYIAAYIFEKHLDEASRFLLIELSKRLSLPIISAGEYLTFANKNLFAKDNNPFYTYINAKYVFTNTFHGTAFAINFEKQFVTLSDNNQKIEELLNLFGISNRNIYGCDTERALSTLESFIDYKELSVKRKKLEEDSNKYIIKIMELCQRQF